MKVAYKAKIHDNSNDLIYEGFAQHFHPLESAVALGLGRGRLYHSGP